MDQFEAARLKTAQREARKARYDVTEPRVEIVNPDWVCKVEVEPQIIKEKPKKHGVFTVNVSLPNGDFSFTITKTNIFSNISPSRLTAAEIKKYMIEGLKPLLGGLD